MQAKLGDFGLAKYLQDYQTQQNKTKISSNQSFQNSRKHLTHITVTSVHGTVAYLPPEYLRSKILSPAVDVYSYGIVLLEMLTGCRAFDGKSLLLDKVMDELEDALKQPTRNCKLLGEFGNLLNFKQKNMREENELMMNQPVDNKFNSNCNCLSCLLYLKLRDTKLPKNLDNLFWFHCTLKLALDCSSKLKKKRPDFASILRNYDTFIDQFRQFNQCNQIFNLTGINTNRNSIASRISSFKDDAIKTPLEYKLWIEYKRKNATAPSPESDDYQSELDKIENKLENKLDFKQQENRLDQRNENENKASLIDESLSTSFSNIQLIPTLESNSKNDDCNQQQSNHDCTEFVDNFEIPLITELGVGRKKADQ